MKNPIISYGAAVLAVILWGSAPAIIVTLYNCLKPMDIVLAEFVTAYIVMCIAHRKPVRVTKLTHELDFFFIGFLGITATAGLLNTSYTYISSGAGSVIYSTSPLIVTLIYMIIKRRITAGIRFWAGGILALAGCSLVTMTGQTQHIEAAGVFLALSSALAWALYVIIYDHLEKTSDYPINGVLRRMFFYGIITTLALLPFTGTNLAPDVILHDKNVLILMLVQGIFMGAVSYLLWNYSCRELGAARTSIFIYGMPFVTLIVSHLVLGESLTALKILGCFVTVTGVFLSQRDNRLSNM